MICKITIFLRIFFNRKKIVKFVKFKNKKIVKFEFSIDGWKRSLCNDRWVRCISEIFSSSSSVCLGAKRTRLMYSMPEPCSSTSYSPSWETHAYEPSRASVTNEHGSLRTHDHSKQYTPVVSVGRVLCTDVQVSQLSACTSDTCISINQSINQNCEIPWERVPYLSALEVCSRQGAIQIHVYLTFN